MEGKEGGREWPRGRPRSFFDDIAQNQGVVTEEATEMGEGRITQKVNAVRLRAKTVSDTHVRFLAT